MKVRGTTTLSNARKIAVLCLATIGLAGCAGLIRDRIYKPVAVAETPITFRGEVPGVISVTNADGLKIQGYYWPAAPGNDTIVVYFHGNGFNQLVGARRAEPLRAGGHGVLVASYRGYGGNPGKPSERGLLVDADAWMAKARQVAPRSRLYVFGHSLGGAIAFEMAARYPTAGVATLGAFTRLADVAPPVARGFLPDRFDNLRAIRRIGTLMLLFHGTKDEIVPFVAAGKLRQASDNRAVVVPIEGAGHHVPLEMLTPRFWSIFSSRQP